jgi:hypothetical protein
MRKKDEITNPTSCLNIALPDEPLFILLGRDPAAPYAIRMWTEGRILAGKNERFDLQITEAEVLADTMDRERALIRQQVVGGPTYERQLFELLDLLDRRGGLGLDVHDKIRALIGDPDERKTPR